MEFKEWAPWVGIGLSLTWNFINWRRAGVLYRRSFEVAEFKALKAPVDAELVKLRAVKAKIRALEISGSAPKKFKEDVSSLNVSVTECFNDLTVVLEVVDASGHSERSDWVERVNNDWDEFISRLDSLYAPKTIEARKFVLEAVVGKLDTLINNVHAKLEEELIKKSNL